MRTVASLALLLSGCTRDMVSIVVGPPSAPTETQGPTTDPTDPTPDPDPSTDPVPPAGTFTPASYVFQEALSRPLEDFRYSQNYRTEMGGTDGSGTSYPFMHDATTGRQIGRAHV